MTRRRPPLLALAALLGALTLAAAACSGGGSSAGRSERSSTTARPPGTTATTAGRAFVPQPLRWEGCEEGECASLRVPLDPARPDGPTIELALARVRARDPDARIGSLLVNPGGPGVGGTGFAAAAASRLPDAVRDRFDVVGWDPRATGRSTRVECGDRLDYLFDVDVAPDDAAERAALEAAGRRFADACAAGSGDLLAHLSTADTVQDMELIRQALGDDRLTYVGFSYGTYLGARYAETFPDRVRALILDGALDPSLDLEQTNVQQAQGFGRSLDAFLGWCASTRCSFGGGDPRAAYESLRARIDARPLTRAGRTLGPSQLDLAVASPLYLGRPAYEHLADALRDAAAGDPGALLDVFDTYVGRDPDGRYDGEWAAFLATSCADGPTVPVADFVAMQARAGMAAPDFGAENVGLGFTCSVWPVAAAEQVPRPARAPSAPPIVVIGTTGDPATPAAWATSLATQLGSGRVVVVDGTSHTSLLNGNRCLDAIAAPYLVDLVAPASGRTCPG
jgi:pimeloyl-ACP methyl ester carboxylesterase